MIRGRKEKRKERCGGVGDGRMVQETDLPYWRFGMRLFVEQIKKREGQGGSGRQQGRGFETLAKRRRSEEGTEKMN